VLQIVNIGYEGCFILCFVYSFIDRRRLNETFNRWTRTEKVTVGTLVESIKHYLQDAAEETNERVKAFVVYVCRSHSSLNATEHKYVMSTNMMEFFLIICIYRSTLLEFLAYLNLEIIRLLRYDMKVCFVVFLIAHGAIALSLFI
jgi:hypothetical protein